MKEHPERTGKLLGVLGTCCLIFIILVSAIFAVQQNKLNEEYDTLIGNNLSAYTKNQKRQLNGKISDILSTMGAVAAVMDTNGLSAKEDWFGPFLNRIGDKNKGYHPSSKRFHRLRPFSCGRGGKLLFCGGYSRIQGGKSYRDPADGNSGYDPHICDTGKQDV
ncbi:hypothetical protein [Blautia pseudococcoides]|nr:hypothetical protein [Blautia pseudococcoides]QQQ94112.1 hypothetical protein I5Q86_04840 [Blautia pseudococcoides]